MLAPNYMSSRMTRPIMNIGNNGKSTLESIIQGNTHSPILGGGTNSYIFQSPMQNGMNVTGGLGGNRVRHSPSISSIQSTSQLQSNRSQLMRRVEDVAREAEERNRAYSVSSRISTRQSKTGTELRYSNYTPPNNYY